jgi:hypothetical protein
MIAHSCQVLYWAACCVTATVLCAAAAVAQPKPGDTKALEDCIRDNAPKVEQAVPSLIDGTNFLVNSLCGDLVPGYIGTEQFVQPSMVDWGNAKRLAASLLLELRLAHTTGKKQR